MLRVDKHVPAVLERRINEIAGWAHVLEQVLVNQVLDRNPHVVEPRPRCLRGHRVCAHGNDVRDTVLGEVARGVCRCMQADIM